MTDPFILTCLKVHNVCNARFGCLGGWAGMPHSTLLLGQLAGRFLSHLA